MKNSRKKNCTYCPYFNLFLFNKYNIGLWPFPEKRYVPSFDGYCMEIGGKYGLTWMGYLFEVSWVNNIEY